jgi:hypothetical protein
MKLFKVLLAGSLALSMMSCFGPNLIYTKEMPKFGPIEGKARVVIIRPVPTFSFSMGGTTDPNYLVAAVFLEKKYTSETYKSTVVSFPVDPGEHYILAKIPGFGMHPMSTMKFNFQSGKVYYIQESVKVSKTPIGEVQACITEPISIDEANKLLTEKKDLKYGEFDKTKPGKDLEDKDYNKQLEDYAKWVKDKPEDAKKESDYPGY